MKTYKVFYNVITALLALNVLFFIFSSVSSEVSLPISWIDDWKLRWIVAMICFLIMFIMQIAFLVQYIRKRKSDSKICLYLLLMAASAGIVSAISSFLALIIPFALFAFAVMMLHPYLYPDEIKEKGK